MCFCFDFIFFSLLLICRKPPMGKGGKKDFKKHSYDEDDEVDPMDPSAYSDAPRGGWYVTRIPYSTI